VPGGSCARLSDVPSEVARLIEECRRATLSTVNPDGTVALVPVCFALDGPRVVSAVDEKPKGDDELARVRNVRREPRVTLLFDRWDEDWSRLGWVAVKGVATIEATVDAALLVARYPQYEGHPPPGPWLTIEPFRIRWWTWE
jgi:PPOX class probable F420-dependent enzyme